ncbi:dTDP-glucose 4,6-dehydratase [Candidatus Gracilibacteria bacterium]|nr:dTDP-glucose 4,6-dehydratase [Candidatus Gracilibacteria bacterium]
MKKIFITGGAGFIGSNFLNRFVKKFPEIDFINLDFLTYAGKLENISGEVKNAKNYFFEKVDIGEKNDLEKIFEKYSKNFETKNIGIIHFAAETHVDNSIKNPKIFVETNVVGTQNLLDLHLKFGFGRFHHISTDEVYGDLPNGGFFTEETPLNPSSPYSASKASSDFLVKAYGRTFGLNYTISRCSNNYGPNQDSEKLIPHFINLLKNNKKLTIYGDGSNIRDWLFVDDHNDAVWEIFTRAEKGKIYNIGGNNEKTNLEISKILLKELGKGEEFLDFVEDRKGHDKRYAIDATKIKEELGWSPKVSFEEGIKRIIGVYL